MAEIKTNETHLKSRIKIKRGSFNALLIMRTTWFYLGGPSEIQQPRLNPNDLHLCVSSEQLIED